MTNGPDPAGLDPRPLLAAYQAVILEIPKLPRVLWVRRGMGGVDRFGRVPRIRFFVRFFTVQHITRSLAQLRRLYSAGAALHPNAAAYEAGASQIEAFEKSLPPHRPRLALVALLLSVCFVSFLIARHVAPDVDPTLIAYLSRENDEDGVGKLPTVRASADPLGKMTSASLTLSPRDFAEALKSFACVPEEREKETVTVCSVRRGLTNSVASLIFLGIAVWLVMLLPITSFRLKRMLFNLQPQAARRISQELALNHSVTAQGVYRIEAEQFRRLDARPPREAPLDLLSQAGILVLPIWVGVAVVVWTGYGIVYLSRNEGLGWGDVLAIAMLLSLAAIVFTLPGARLASLRRVYTRRVADARSELPEEPSEEPASWPRRAAAHALDSILVLVLWAALAVPLSRMDIPGDAQILAIAGALIAAWAACTGFLLLRGGDQRGRSLGKQALGLRVVCPSGEPPSAGRLLFREVVLKGYVFGLASILLAGLPALLDYLFPLGHARNRALHDLVGDTIVVRERPAEAPVAVPSALAH